MLLVRAPHCELYITFTYSINAVSFLFLYLRTVYEALKRYVQL